MRRGTAVNACLLDCSKAFDKCRFDKLFKKLIDKGLPPLIVRVLIFVYEEQTAWVTLAGHKSEQFKISNGTRQGSVLSPVIFSVYLDGLLSELRRRGLGCFIGGYWVGACGYADDIILMSPNRHMLQKMIDVCEVYAVDHNLTFSTDLVPARSKTKCIYFCGRQNRVVYPDPLRLAGKELPWVKSADHLGHILSQHCSMDPDCNRARQKFISASCDIREQLFFANPQEIIKAVEIMAMDAYGCMLWSLSNETSQKFFRCWNTLVKIIYNIPRSTYTYLIEGFFASQSTSLRSQILSRYATFYWKLVNSSSSEIRAISRIVEKDPRSPSYSNLRYITSLTSLDQPYMYSKQRIKIALPRKEVPDGEKWTFGLLVSLLELRRVKNVKAEDSKSICAMIDSLCST